MSRYKLILTVALTAFMLTACSVATPAQPTPLPTQAPTAPVTAGDLAGTAWKLVSFGPAGTENTALPGSNVTLTFDNQGQAGGNGGCNSYGGSYEAKQGQLTIGQLMRTLMACADNAVTQQEDAYLSALEKAAQYQITGDQLVITTADGATRLTFTRGS